jgi:hypothetical protein
MGWRTYVDAVQRQGRKHYYLKRIDDRLAGPHPVLPGTDGRVDFYATEADARQAARTLKEPIEAKAPITLDMDAVYAWASDARVETIDYAMLLSALHRLEDLGVLEPMPIEFDRSSPDYVLSEVHEKIDIGYSLASDSRSPFDAPVWTAGELATLVHTLLHGLDALDDRLRDAPTASQ